MQKLQDINFKNKMTKNKKNETKVDAGASYDKK